MVAFLRTFVSTTAGLPRLRRFPPIAAAAMLCLASWFLSETNALQGDIPRATVRPQLHPHLQAHLESVQSGKAAERNELSYLSKNGDLGEHVKASSTVLCISPPFDRSSRNIIIGLVWGLGAETARFARSVARHAPGSRLVVLVPTDEDLNEKAYLERMGAQVIRVQLSHYKSAGGELERFALFSSLLDASGEGALHNIPDDAWVIITDIRDVVLQGDPFAMARARWPNKVVFGEEDGRLTIGTCPFNSAWVLYLFGEAGLDKMGDDRVSCSGVTLGHIAPLRRYLSAMQQLADEVVAQSGGYGSIRRGSDQGIHNCIVRGKCAATTTDFDAERDAAFSPNRGSDSIVFTMAWVPWDDIAVDPFGIVKARGESSAPPILHQFDRHVSIERMINAMYPFISGKL